MKSEQKEGSRENGTFLLGSLNYDTVEQLTREYRVIVLKLLSGRMPHMGGGAQGLSGEGGHEPSCPLPHSYATA